ncbi:putative gRAM domain [Synechococcus sp. MEDNS5]|uniref:hypothetical protein n=1 Tax=Synechococcus sp. MEDNS5 TaxID=1442554 RepID=UPI001647C83E|nr:hypothetical protein [Synechococcus sp. MEDNS5]QNJ06531.1 putative gRAM domain [Synechococcus sp. MEDNS5]
MKTTPLLLALASAIGGLVAMAPAANAATTYLVLGTYQQAGGGKPKVAQYSSPSLQILPMESIEQCEAAGRQITAKIYKPIWDFDGRWTCVEGK